MSVRTERVQVPRRDIATIAEARLGASSHPELRRIQCKSEEGSLFLDGRLSSYFQKQLAQEIVPKIDGVERIVNQIEVIGRMT
jgi:osmotically-inducible protein OsmY